MVILMAEDEEEDEEYRERKKRREYPFGSMFGFGNIDKEFERMQKLMDEMLKGGFPNMSKPLVYGFSVKKGSNGKPHVQEFGNAKGYFTRGDEGTEWTPLTDVQEDPDGVTVTVDIPGVEKEDIDLQVMDNKLVINVDGARKYKTEVKLPSSVKTEEADASYKNGVLEVKLKKSEEKKGESIKIE